jgi:hypothetical protein
MFSKAMSVALLASAVVVSMAIPAVAQDTGLAGMHSMRREGGRTCMSDHWHYGSSGGSHSTKAAAKRAAIASWQDFTDLDYGRAWARFSRAASKKMGCSNSASGWSCDAEARPCR